MLLAAVNEYSGNVYIYTYDNLGQLVREDNSILGKIYIYTYDNAGNITSKSEYAHTIYTPSNLISTLTYTYGDESGMDDTGDLVWGDLLTEYDGVVITYDGIKQFVYDPIRNGLLQQ